MEVFTEKRGFQDHLLLGGTKTSVEERKYLGRKWLLPHRGLDSHLCLGVPLGPFPGAGLCYSLGAR